MTQHAEPVVSLDLEKSYQGFSLRCKADLGSGITAVFGRSGSGKTTLLNCIAGIERPDSGSISIHGERAFHSERPAINLPPERRRVGYVMQSAGLFPHMTVAGNIAYGHNLLDNAARTVSPAAVIDLLGLSHLLERPVAGLSGGEAQRVALARALATSPRLLLLDEPLSSLDAPMRGAIIRYLRTVRSELGTPMLLVSHSLSEVLALADQALVLSGGSVVAHGSPTSVLEDPEVGALTDYFELENLLEATIVRTSDGTSPGMVRVGSVDIEALDVVGDRGEDLTVSIGASDVIVASSRPSGLSARNVLAAQLTALRPVGQRTLAYFDVGTRIVVELTAAAVAELDLRPGNTAYLIIKTSSVRTFSRI